MEGFLKLTVSEFWDKHKNDNNCMVIPTMDFFGNKSESVYGDMFFNSEFRYIYLSKHGDNFVIYNPYGKDYECYYDTEISEILVYIYKIIYKHYKSFIDTFAERLYYEYDSVLYESQYPNEYNYFKYHRKNVIGEYEVVYHLDDTGGMHIVDIKKTSP